MTRIDGDPDALTESVAESAGPSGGTGMLSLPLREVPLGGLRAMQVRRALPQRDLPMVGAWCFLDRFGPQSTVMRVDPHPHFGLQTVTWPIRGDVRHRDSVGSDVVVRRGTLNLMTAGAGISHSEYSVGEADVELDALQLWVALPEATRFGAASFEQHEELPVLTWPGGAEATIVLGELAGQRSPASAHTPIVGAEVRVPPDTAITVALTSEWEHALLLIDGDLSVAGTDAAASVDLDTETLVYLGTDRNAVRLSSSRGGRVFLLGGKPFADEIVMWWNFVGRSHEEIVAARDAWEASDARFGTVVEHGAERVPAPPLPAVRLTRRRRRV